MRSKCVAHKEVGFHPHPLFPHRISPLLEQSLIMSGAKMNGLELKILNGFLSQYFETLNDPTIRQ